MFANVKNMNSRAIENDIGFRTDNNDSVAAIASSGIMPRPIILYLTLDTF